MNKTALYGIIALTVVAAVFGLIVAFSKNEQTSTIGGTSTSTGGIGETFLSAACAAFGIKC